jgi:hypothetical protein
VNLEQLLAHYEWLFFPLTMLGISSVLMLVVARVARRRGAGFSLPRPATAPSVRWGEAALWTAGVGLVLALFREQFSESFQNPNTVPALLAEAGRRCWWCALASVPAVLAAAFRRTLGACLCLAAVAFIALNPSQPFYNWPAVQAAVAESPLPFTIATPAGLPAVNVTINDVPFGPTPVVTTWEEVKSRTPAWKVEAEFHHQKRGGTLVWLPLRVTHFERPGGGQEDKQQLFVRCHLGNRPLFLYGQDRFQWSGFVGNPFSGGGPVMNSGMRANGQIFPFRFELEMTLGEWGDEVQFLVHRARLLDYAVDDEWCTALESYGALGQAALIGLSASDPALQKVTDALARRIDPLPENLGEAEAWQRLLAFIDQAAERGEFQLAGTDGSIARGLAARISDSALARQIADELAAPVLLPGHGVETYTAGSGAVTKIRITPRGRPITGAAERRSLRGPVLQQLAVERDAALDAVSPEPDNPIEIYVAPAAMRAHRVGDGPERRIQGHAYEQALSRHNWHTLSPEASEWDDFDHVQGGTINRWLKLLGELDSPFGRNFRLTHPHEFLKLAQEFWSNSAMVFFNLGDVEFLFREHRADLPRVEKEGKAEERKTLAELFWKKLTSQRDRPALGDASEELTIRWRYLARMSPDSRPEDFVQALRDLDPEWVQNNNGEFLKQMPAGQAVATLRALLDELERPQPAQTKKHRSRGLAQDGIGLIRQALAIDDEGMADFIVSQFERPDGAFDGQSIAGDLREGRVSLMVLEKLAKCRQPALRQLVAESGLFRTSPVERRVVETLSRDPDAAVATAAQGVLQQWAEWRSRALPRRAMPSVGG